MRLLIFLATLPLIASPINSTSVQTFCHWNGNTLPPPTQFAFTLTDSSGSGSSSVSCPINYVGPSVSASSTVSGEDAMAFASQGAIGSGGGEGHDSFPQETISNVLEPVQAGEAYTLDAQSTAEVEGIYSATATVEVETATPEPRLTLLVGFVCLGFLVLRAKSV